MCVFRNLNKYLVVCTNFLPPGFFLFLGGRYVHTSLTTLFWSSYPYLPCSLFFILSHTTSLIQRSYETITGHLEPGEFSFRREALLRRQGQGQPFELEATLVYMVSSRTAIERLCLIKELAKNRAVEGSFWRGDSPFHFYSYR